MYVNHNVNKMGHNFIMGLNLEKLKSVKENE